MTRVLVRDVFWCRTGFSAGRVLVREIGYASEAQLLANNKKQKAVSCSKAQPLADNRPKPAQFSCAAFISAAVAFLVGFQSCVNICLPLQLSKAYSWLR